VLSQSTEQATTVWYIGNLVVMLFPLSIRERECVYLPQNNKKKDTKSYL